MMALVISVMRTQEDKKEQESTILNITIHVSVIQMTDNNGKVMKLVCLLTDVFGQIP